VGSDPAALCQPDGFVLEYGVYFDRIIFGFVEDDFGLVHGVTPNL
jgi:hypothetical protein